MLSSFGIDRFSSGMLANDTWASSTNQLPVLSSPKRIMSIKETNSKRNPNCTLFICANSAHFSGISKSRDSLCHIEMRFCHLPLRVRSAIRTASYCTTPNALIRGMCPDAERYLLNDKCRTSPHQFQQPFPRRCWRTSRIQHFVKCLEVQKSPLMIINSLPSGVQQASVLFRVTSCPATKTGASVVLGLN